jgi:hypothetical protein
LSKDREIRNEQKIKRKQDIKPDLQFIINEFLKSYQTLKDSKTLNNHQ